MRLFTKSQPAELTSNMISDFSTERVSPTAQRANQTPQQKNMELQTSECSRGSSGIAVDVDEWAPLPDEDSANSSNFMNWLIWAAARWA
jgi:hypothetical protein